VKVTSTLTRARSQASSGRFKARLADLKRRRKFIDWRAAPDFARELGDPGLFENAKLTANPELSSPACMEMAEVYLENDDPEMALFWMERIPPTDRFRADAQDRLLDSIYEQLGNREKMIETARTTKRASLRSTIASGASGQSTESKSGRGVGLSC